MNKESLLNAMPFRCIGPPRGGRVIAVAGDPTDLGTFYFGACAGGVWKTTDAGTTWANISDGYFKTASVGALTVSESNPNVIYAGMGEATIRTDVSYGDGVYKSTDGGTTWTHMGLTDTRHIGEIRIHPHNPDIVYVAALGHAFGPNKERGVFRSRDGGNSWEKVLYKSTNAGAIDLALDPLNPDVLYASIWEGRRTFWGLSSGGEESGLWKSTDGGDTWAEISDNPGLPSGIKGKIGVAASPAKAGRVWALVEAHEGALFRSDDFGVTWQKMTDKQDLRYRPWYFHHVFADPQDEDTVYVMNLNMWKSCDGGKTFTDIPTPHGDNHDLWIDPNNNRRMVQGNDGGANVSFNGGETFSTIYNQLTAQFYHIDTDNQYPYRIYGTQQDNSSISVPSDALAGVINWGDCYAAGTGESGYIAVHPENSDLVYVGAVGSSPGGGGALQRYDHSTGQIQLVNVWPEEFSGFGPDGLKYRFPWTFPILFSPHDVNRLYTTGNVAFRSNDEGMSWEPFSPDLTRADMSKLVPAGGPITKDTSGAEHYATISTLRESTHEAGTFWVGSDDGLVHISRDNGGNWQNVTPIDLPEWAFIRTVEPSPHDPATLYLAATRYKLDDNTPYLYKTTDYGESWQLITEGIPADDYTRVIRADPTVAGLLYAGTETGLYVSVDDGTNWQRWQSNLPVVPIYDLKIKNNDLVLATHGRSFWILDDLTPLYQLAQAAGESSHGLYTPRTTVRLVPDIFAGWSAGEGKSYGMGLGKEAISVGKKNDLGVLERTYLDSGQGAPSGVIVYYHLAESVEDGANVTLAFSDESGTLIREFSPKPADYDKRNEKEQSMEPGPWIGTSAGVHRFIWDMRYPGSRRVLGEKTAGAAYSGPLIVPGTYRVTLTVGGQSQEATFTVISDPRVDTPQGDFEDQLALLLQIHDKITQAHDGIIQLRDVRAQAEGWRKRLAENEAVTQAVDSLLEKLAAIEKELVMPGDQSDTFGLNVPFGLNARLASVISVAGSADRAPTQQSREMATEYSEQIDAQLAELQAVLDEELVALNGLIAAAGVPAIVTS